ncbi:hypothetical protein ACTL6U_14420 [Rhodovibrionaceae bacterium A322]
MSNPTDLPTDPTPEGPTNPTQAELDFSKLPDDRPLAPLALGETLKGVFGCALASAPAISRLAALPLLISFLMGAFVHFGGASFFTLILMADLYLSVWFCCAVQRAILLGPGSVSLAPLWGNREVRYLLKTLGLFGFIFLAALPINMALAPKLDPGTEIAMEMMLETALPMVAAISLVALILGCALGFTLPAASVGRGYGYGRAFRESLGVLPVLVFMFLLLILPVDGLTLVANVLLAKFEGATSLVVPGLAVAAVGKYLSFAWASIAFAYVFAKRTRFWEETA